MSVWLLTEVRIIKFGREITAREPRLTRLSPLFYKCLAFIVINKFICIEGVIIFNHIGIHMSRRGYECERHTFLGCYV
jgi:hypothetical protein